MAISEFEHGKTRIMAEARDALVAPSGRAGFLAAGYQPGAAIFPGLLNVG